MNLAATEEQLMNFIWEKGSAFMKDLLEAYPDPKPAPTTVATLLKRLTDKGALSFKTFGNSREYFPLLSKSAYFSGKVNHLIKNFFN
ncbi:MAG: BlaI/MecI/CopY family transcriptional regulator, partial [Cyclobacteriaceae bacterium]|nr:BlaI/MecI/CopY family transcriptional regulator [Cyclobacteriaceae bacterium]